MRLQSKVLFLFAALSPAVASQAAGVESDRGALWRVVQPCVADHALTGAAFPCLDINMSGGRGSEATSFSGGAQGTGSLPFARAETDPQSRPQWGPPPARPDAGHAGRYLGFYESWAHGLEQHLSRTS
jgi:hypothetical protein